MRHSIRRKTVKNKQKNNRKTRYNKSGYRKKIGGAISAANVMDAYNAVSKTSQGLYDAYLNAKEKYDNIMQKYQEMQAKYQEMQQTLDKIKNDPEVQQHLNTLSNLHSQIQSMNTPPSSSQVPLTQSAGFFNMSNLNTGMSNLNTGIQSANTLYSQKKQQARAVYGNPQVQQNLSDLSKHSYNTAKQGSLFGVNVATGAPISAAYRGYNTYQSARKGVTSAQNLYRSASDAYKSSVPQQNI